MPELLIEFLSEEIPARMQADAAEQLARLVEKHLRGLGYTPEGILANSGPRRLTVVVPELPETQPTQQVERKGPRADAPAAAIEGFLKANNLSSVDALERRATDKGDVYFLSLSSGGGSTRDLIPQVIEAAARELPWPKSMRWAAYDLRWVRPLKGVLCLFGGARVTGALTLSPGKSLAFDNRTSGHRFLAPQPFEVSDFADYKAKLAAAHVLFDRAERRRVIHEQARAKAASAGLALLEDDGLLDEVTGLVEWPTVLLGSIDAAFMELPPEVLTTSMRSHQKYFSTRTKDGALAPHFLVVSNMTTADGGAAIVAGNERVLRARLSDAKFFWDLDRRTPMADMAAKLTQRIFHAKLGTVADRVERLVALAGRLAPLVGADARLAERAARLAKADLSSGMVGEFPELQGVMGRYLARHAGEPAEIAEAIADHYSPQGPGDRCPSAPVSVAVALAEKIDVLAGFFAIDERPTGSKDPFALRRAALGLLRLIAENGLRLNLKPLFAAALALYPSRPRPAEDAAVTDQVLGFLVDRAKVYLRERGVRHDLIQAVSGLGEDDFVRLDARVAALADFLASETGADLLAAYRRAGNILKIEEKKGAISGQVDMAIMREDAERALAEALGAVRIAADKALAAEDFRGAMTSFGSLRAPVDAFFTDVTVNAPETELRMNRLRLLNDVRSIFSRVADFSAIEG